MELVLILAAMMAFLGLAVGPALAMDAQAHRSVAVDPPLTHTLRFGPNQLIHRIAEGHPLLQDPRVLGPAEALMALPGSTWFDGRTLAWDGPRSSVGAADETLAEFRDALLVYALRPWFAVAEQHGLAGDREQLSGQVDGLDVRLWVDAHTIHLRVGYGPDEIKVRRDETHGDTPIGDPILDLLHLEGPPHLLASLATDELREELMAGVHGLGMEVAHGMLTLSRKRVEPTALAEDVAHALSLARLLRARLDPGDRASTSDR